MVVQRYLEVWIVKKSPVANERGQTFVKDRI